MDDSQPKPLQQQLDDLAGQVVQTNARIDALSGSTSPPTDATIQQRLDALGTGLSAVNARLAAVDTALLKLNADLGLHQQWLEGGGKPADPTAPDPTPDPAPVA